MSRRAAKGPLKFDLACGQRKQEGHVGVDIAPAAGVDIVADLFKPWTFAQPGTVDSLFTSHFIEHIPSDWLPPKDRLFWFFDQGYRLLKPGGTWTIIAPYYNSIRCWQDPTHRRGISERTFLYANKTWRETNGLDHYPITCDFDFVYAYAITGVWASREASAQAFAIQHYTNVVDDIHATLTKRG